MLSSQKKSFSKLFIPAEKSAKNVRSIEFKSVCIVLFLCITFFSQDSNAHQRKGVSIYVINEQNVNDSIIGFGVSTLHKVNNSDFGFVVDSSLSNAEVVDNDGYEQHYLAWELGGKVGYFSDVFLYAEFGFDFGELAFQDRDEEEYYTYASDEGYYDEFDIDLRPRRDDYSNDIDAYIGVGTGIQLGHIQLTAYARYRQIDGEYWKANNQAFTGFRAAIVF